MTALNGRLLVLYDGSSVADRALDAALGRAEKKGEHITVMIAIPARLWRAKQGQFPTSLDAHDEEFARRQLARAADRCKTAGVPAEEVLLTGPLIEIIVEESKKGYNALFVGERQSLASRPSLPALLRPKAGCDVIAVP